MDLKAQRDIKRKLAVLEHERESGNISKTCRHFGISRETYYKWKRGFETEGEEALINSKPCPVNLKLRTPQPVEEQILYLRKTYHLGPLRIAWYLQRYHQIKISQGGVRGVLRARSKMIILSNGDRLGSKRVYGELQSELPTFHSGF